MSPQQTDRRHFERQLSMRAAIVLLLGASCHFEQPPSRFVRHAAVFLIAYLVVSVFIIVLQRLFRERGWHLPLFCDIFALPVSIDHPALWLIWFPYLFLCYAAGCRWGIRAATPFAGVLSLALIVRTALEGQMVDAHFAWLGLVAATLWLGWLSRSSAISAAAMPRKTNFSRALPIHAGRSGLAESLRQFLQKLATAFRTEEALLIFVMPTWNAFFLWRLKAGKRAAGSRKHSSRTGPDDFLLDDMDAAICWNTLKAPALDLAGSPRWPHFEILAGGCQAPHSSNST